MIQPVLLPVINSIQGGVFQRADARLRVVTQHVPQSADMLLGAARSPDLSAKEHIWNIIGRQLQYHPKPGITDTILTDQEQQE